MSDSNGAAPGSLADILDRVLERAAAEPLPSFRSLAEAAALDPASDFISASLRDMDFRDQDLRGFDFSRADLTGADFRRARIDGVRFDGADLTGAIGLSKDAATRRPIYPERIMPRRTVMISSTARDLPEHREQVRLACEHAGFAPHDMMEHLTALNAHAIDASLKMVEQADVYVGIFANRYGYVPDGYDISITEMEYNRAVELNKPRLIFFHHDDHVFKTKDVDTGPGAEKLKALKERLGKAHVVAFFKSADDLRAHVLAALTNLAKDLDAIQTAEEDKPNASHTVTAQAVVAELRRQGFVAKAADAGVGERAVLELARRLKPNEDLTLEQAVKEVSAAVETAIDVISKGGRGSNLDDLVNAVLARIAEKTGAGDLEGAAREADRGFAEWERAEAERRDASVQSGIALLEAGLEQDILRRDALAAARRVEKIVALEHPDATAARFAALRERQAAFYVSGRDKGINFDLLVATEIARLVLASAQGTEQRGDALNDLGVVLRTLGERESGTAKLEETVATYREALKERTRERVPLRWAMTQNSLGIALGCLGERESGAMKLAESVAAFREALKEWTRERVPLQWAMTQNNLGNALGRLGERESGTAKLEESVAAYREALKEWTRERVPLDWAGTQNNLGFALFRLGARENETGKFEEAVAAYREALEEWTRERVPLDWAGTQTNLGNALTSLGERESGTAKLEEAVAAYREALKEATSERVPLQWATSLGNEGVALMLLAERRGDAAMAEIALGQINMAFETLRDGGHAPGAAYLENQLPGARALVDQLRRR
jgi:tetratricopeptide (TPR) repeat protein